MKIAVVLGVDDTMGLNVGGWIKANCERLLTECIVPFGIVLIYEVKIGKDVESMICKLIIKILKWPVRPCEVLSSQLV